MDTNELLYKQKWPYNIAKHLIVTKRESGRHGEMS